MAEAAEGRFLVLVVINFAQQLFLACFFRIHPVQSVVNSPTQLSGRGFPHIFYMKLVLSQHYAFLVLQTGSRAVQFDILRIYNLRCIKCKI